MHRSLFLAFLFLVPGLLLGQFKTNILPTAKKAHLVVFLKDFDKAPIRNATLILQADEEETTYKTRTNKRGIAEFLIPNGRSYSVQVEDSAGWERIHIEKKSMLVKRHTIYFQGAVNGKLRLPTRPDFRMMRPADGMARVEIKLLDRKGKPLKDEQIALYSKWKDKAWKLRTDAAGNAAFTVPMGDRYTVQLAYNRAAGSLDIKRHGASANIKATYRYAGEAAIKADLARYAAHQAAMARQQALSDQKVAQMDSLRQARPDTFIPGRTHMQAEMLRFEDYAQSEMEALAAGTGGKTYLQDDTQKEIELLVAALRAHARPGADIVFLIDQTSTMWNEVDALRANMETLDAALKEFQDIRVAVCLFGDRHEDRFWFRKFDFGTGFGKARNIIQNRIAVGGGGREIPDSVYDALFRTYKELSWQSTAGRMVLLFSDAPPHSGAATDHPRDGIIQLYQKGETAVEIYPILLQIDTE